MINKRKNVFGVLGGMGPLASAEFLKTIYEHCLGVREQDAPVVLMYSDPTFPDRTDHLPADADDLLLNQLIQGLEHLRAGGAARIVICCITIHHLLHRVPAEVRALVWSLPDLIFAQLAQSRRRHLLICTKGTRALGIFEQHPRWSEARHLVVLPDARDQDAIHDLIYQIKRKCDVRQLTPLLEDLLAKYQVDSFIAGCTETHILAKEFLSAPGQPKSYQCIDPLVSVAQVLANAQERAKTSV
jgi:aspartate racemase